MALADTQLVALPVGLLRARGNYELKLTVSYVEANGPELIDEEAE